jgi:hypothetical protein
VVGVLPLGGGGGKEVERVHCHRVTTFKQYF